MKQSINLSIFSVTGSEIRKNLLKVISFFITTIFMISCRKDAAEKTDLSLSADSTVTRQSALTALASGNTYYISPSGSDNNTGTQNSPWFTLTKAWASVNAGDTLYVRGGTYAYTKAPYLDGKNGTAFNKIHVFGYPGERPVITRASNYTWEPQFHRSGVYFEGNYFHWKNIRFTGFFQPAGNSNVHSAFMAYHSSNNIFEWLEFDNSGAGFSMEGNSTNNLVLNCDGHDNKDPYTSYGNSDGIQLTYCASGTVNTVRNSRAWNNGDDGFDVFENQGFVTFENCWSYHNGFIPGTNNQGGNGNGFKFGYSANDNQIRRTLRNCIAVSNRLTGFDIQEATCRLQIDNSIAYNNGNGTGQAFGFHTNYQTRAHIIRNCVAFNNNEEEANLNSQTISTTCSNDDGSSGWTNNAGSSDFQSTDVTQITRSRKADGSLPDITFLKPAAGSDLINTGTNIGLPFSGSAPDRGAFESGGTTTPPPANQPPVANAGTDKSIILPVNTITQAGSGTDPDGTIAAYVWAKVSGPSATIVSPSSPQTVINNLLQGTYVFRLTVTDNNGATSADDMTVTVSSASPAPVPSAVINVAQAVNWSGYGHYVVQDFGTLPDISSNPARSVLRIFENGVELKPSHSAHSDISSLGMGRFSHWGDGSFVALYFSASDNTNPKTNGRTYTYSAGTAAPNQYPVANAGADRSVTLPANSLTLTGAGTDPDGTIASYAWTKISGPSGFSIVSPGNSQTVINGLVQGNYVFRLTVTDNKGAVAYDDVTVSVNAAAKLINVSKAVNWSGYGYYVVQNFGTLPDINTNSTRSVLRIFENGVELKPPHSAHSDISTLGRGRFSHWGDGSFVALYFSASDNTNPKTNGRTYTYTTGN